ncbi:hypothetical protein [Caminibacter sp.]
MKKLLTVFIGGTMLSSMLYAGPVNYVGLSDIKDALYYLIKDYKKLLAKSNNNEKKILKIEKEFDAEVNQIKKVIKTRNFKVDNELKEIFKIISSLKRRALLIKEKEDGYDRYITQYVKENKKVLKKIKR